MIRILVIVILVMMLAGCGIPKKIVYPNFQDDFVPRWEA